jgi:NAD(P)-dependent dehydrogenase (short-subunit alcohol dehydrogenase family)
MSSSRSIIVTGANSGLGLEAAKELARDRSNLIIVACRNPQAGRNAVADLQTSGATAAFLPLDLNNQQSIREFVDAFRAAKLPPLFAIVCNAGTQNVAKQETTIEGFETTFAVNHLGHYLLVRLLLDDLMPDGRVAIVASGVHDPKTKSGLPEPVYEDAEAVAHDLKQGRPAGLRRYSTSKLCNVFFTYELSHRLANSGDARLKSIKVNAFDPGFMPTTGLARSWPPFLRWVSGNVLPLLRFVIKNVHTPEVSGARLAALTLGKDASPGGRYFSDGKAVPSSDLSYDQKKQHELWVSSARMTALPENIKAAAS